MKILFMRHGESKSQAKLVQNTDPDSWNGLTEVGTMQVKNAAENCQIKIDAVYSSPYNRAILTAQTFLDTRGDKQNIAIDERLREIDYGFHGGDTKKHPEMIEVAMKQIAGDYEVRFGRYGENKREIVTRFFGFLVDVYNSHNPDDVILAVSHGRAISIIDYEFGTVNDIEKEHAGTKNAQIKEVELTKESVEKLVKYIEKLNLEEIKRRYDLIENTVPAEDALKPYLLELARTRVDDLDVSYEVLELFVNGAYKSELTPVGSTINKEKLTDKDVVLITAIQDSADFIPYFIKHYAEIGVKSLVFIDNDSKDGSVELIKKLAAEYGVFVDIWHTADKYNGRKLMGWRRHLMTYYGLNRWFLSVDSDELLVFGHDNINAFTTELESKKLLAAGAIMIDMYPNSTFANMDNIAQDDIMKEYRYFDVGTYESFANRKYNRRVFGGPRQRLFDISPSLQKFPLVYATEETIGINPHFWHPYKINAQTAFVAGLLHYKFLPGYRKKYAANAEKGLYYNNSAEYKVYVEKVEQDPQASFYDSHISQEYKGFDSLKTILD